MEFARYQDVKVRLGGTLHVVGGKLVRFNTVELPIKESLLAVLPTLRRTLEEVNPAGRTRGPKPRDHESVVAVVRKFGPKWKSHLKEICEELDAQDIAPPHRKGTGVTRWSWSEFLNEPDGRSGVKKSINESLRKFPK
ncbi:MAG: hypothetical protein JST93_02395 [Acidobacteria bacterium]|nr:hypothetical protein [Acidobacteriota bacterium]